MKMVCKYCNWWDGNEKASWNICKASGPSICLTDENDPITVWPETRSDDWCRLFSDRHKEEIERDTDDTIRIFVGTENGIHIGDYPRMLGVHDVINTVMSKMSIKRGNYVLRRLIDHEEFGFGDYMMDLEDCSRFDLIMEDENSN